MSYQFHQDSQASHQKSCPKDENTTLHQPMTGSTGHMNRRFGVRLLQPLSLKTKVTVATAISTLSLLATGTTAYPLAHQSTRKQINQAQQTRASALADYDNIVVKSNNFTSNNRYQLVSDLAWKTPNGLPSFNREVIFAVNKATAFAPQQDLLLTLVIRTVLSALVVIAMDEVPPKGRSLLSCISGASVPS